MLAVAVAIANLTAGCDGHSSSVGLTPPSTDKSGLPIAQPVTRSELLRFPVAHLRFPGSVTVEVVGMDQTPTRPGEEPNPAFTGAILVASTTPAALYLWYETALDKQGFRPASDFRPADQTSGQAWQRQTRLEVQVGVFDPVLLREDRGVAVNLKPGQVAYEAVVVGYPPGLPRT